MLPNVTHVTREWRDSGIRETAHEDPNLAKA